MVCPPWREDKLESDGGSEQDTDNGDSDDTDPVLDSFYSWVVVLAAVVIFTFLVGLHRSMGLIFLTLLDQHGRSQADAMEIGAVFISATFLISPLTGALCAHHGPRPVATAGALLCSLGYLLSSATTRPQLLCLTHGLVAGVGTGLTNTPALLAVASYFRRRRGLANGVVMMGAAAGGACLPPLVETLLDSYGLDWTYRLLAALQLNMVAAAALFRPLDLQRKIVGQLQRRPPAAEQGGQTEKAATPGTIEKAAEPGHTTTLLSPPPTAGGNRLSLAASSLVLSHFSLVADTGEKDGGPTEGGSTAGRLWRRTLKFVDLRLLTEPQFLWIIGFVVLYNTTLPQATLLLPSVAGSHGVSRAESARMASLAAPLDCGSRLLTGWLLDRRRWPQRLSVSLVAAAAALGVVLLTSAGSWTGLFAATVSCYTSLGCYFVVLPVVCAAALGVDRLPYSLTLANLAAGVINLAAQPAAAALRRTTGSLQPVLLLMAACSGAGALLALVAPSVIKCRASAAAKRHEQVATGNELPT